MPKKSIQRILIANRGEIATRIAKTIKLMNKTSVGLYIQVEKNAPYVIHLDEAYELPLNQLSAFLDMETIISIAKNKKIDAIHPGYGFLSENANFAQKVIDAGMIWIGPKPETIEKLGNKEQAKRIAASQGVSILQTTYEEVERDTSFEKKIKKLPLPVLIKPMMGGGGKGMAVLRDFKGLSSQLEESHAIAKQAFGDGRLMAEPYLEKPRHVEIQVVCDQHGNISTLGERDCTVQRRHQKMVEEAVCTHLNDKTRESLHRDAKSILKACNYVNVGTVEFLLDQNNQYYFMEVNTRLQVEHVATEMVFSIDIVKLQIQIAEGTSVDLSSSTPNGHAIEVRIYAENPDQHFLPSTGLLKNVTLPAENQNVRVDHNVKDGQAITLLFDPLLLKVTAWGSSRSDAIQNLLSALDQVRLVGVQTNHSYLAWTLQHSDFLSMNINTQWVDSTYPAYLRYREEHLDEAVRIWQYQQWESSHSLWAHDPWNAFVQNQTPCIDHWTWNQQDIPSHYISKQEDPWIDYHSLYKNGDQDWIYFHHHWYVFKKKKFTSSSKNNAVENQIVAPMTATVIKIHALEGQKVEKDEILIELEAMKMQYKLLAPIAGKIEKLHCSLLQVVSQDQLLIEVAI